MLDLIEFKIKKLKMLSGKSDKKLSANSVKKHNDRRVGDLNIDLFILFWFAFSISHE